MAPKPNRRLGYALRRARRSIQISQRYLAHLFLCDEATIRSWEIHGVPEKRAISVRAFIHSTKQPYPSIHIDLATRGRVRTFNKMLTNWAKT